jgi:hypothetical protein
MKTYNFHTEADASAFIARADRLDFTSSKAWFDGGFWHVTSTM